MTSRGTSQHAYAILRLDWLDTPLGGFRDGSGPNIGAGAVDITVKEIVLSEAEALSEVARLNTLNAGKGCRYYWQQSRLSSNGGPFGAEERGKKTR